MSLVELKDVVKRYGDNTVLNGVSLTVEKGEIIAIIGRSGSGKSTMLNLLGCLDRPTDGSYYLGGRDVAGLDDDELSEMECYDCNVF